MAHKLSIVTLCPFVLSLLFLPSLDARGSADFNTPDLSSVTWLNAYHETFDTLDTSQIISTSDGGYMLAGYGGLLKLDALGNVQWQRVYRCCGYYDPFGLSGVVEVPEGYFAVGASSIQPSGSAILALRLDQEGEVIWSKRYRVEKYNSAGKVIRTRDGGYLVAGYTSPGRNGRTLLLKLGGGGAIQWQKTYNVRPVTSVAQLSNGDFLFSTDYFSVLRLNSHGNVRWQRKYSGRGCCGLGVMSVSPTGGFFLAGRVSYEAPDGKASVLVLKADSSGNILISKRLTDTRSYFDLRGLAGTLDQGVVLNVERFDFRNPHRTTIFKLDSGGTLSWRKEYFYRPVGGFTFATAIHQTPDGGYLLAGVRSWLAKLDADGNIYCKNIVRSASTTILDYPITFERHFPNVVSTHAVPENEPVTSTPLTPVVEKVCAPN